MTTTTGKNQRSNIVLSPLYGHGHAYYISTDRRLAQQAITTPGPAPESDYGSDFDTDTEEQLALFLTEQFSLEGTVRPLVLESIDQDAGNGDIQPVVHIPLPPSSRVPEVDFSQELAKFAEDVERKDKQAFTIEYDIKSESTHLVAQDEHPLRSSQLDPKAEQIGNGAEDTRSPLERFRTKPKKPLSVTDLVSPAWCELQYWFTLTKHGRKRRTPAMKQGSAVHKVLEEQVHKTVKVNVNTREDTWGLKIWNAIQGLRTLRATGMTRELEIWSTIDGQVINGIIDELSYTPPQQAPEEDNAQVATIADRFSAGNGQQMSIDNFFRSQSATQLNDSPEEQMSPWVDNEGFDRQVYLTDVKTRGAKSLPAGSSLRPTKMQLMLYYRMLSALVAGQVDQLVLFERYNVEPNTPFTDAFIAQVGSLSFAIDDDNLESDDEPPRASQNGVSELLQYNSLNQLWALLIAEYKKAIPMLTETIPAISDLVTAEFRRSEDGTILGSKVFRYDEEAVERYIHTEMQWWKGERAAVGVDIEEAFKCRICEFADVCDWRKNKVDEAIEKTRSKRGRPRKTPV